MGVVSNIINSNLNDFNKVNLDYKGALSALLQYFKCGSKGGDWLSVTYEPIYWKDCSFLPNEMFGLGSLGSVFPIREEEDGW